MLTKLQTYLSAFVSWFQKYETWLAIAGLVLGAVAVFHLL